MTAIVAVMNKHAVSVAADSAATISSSNNQKVFNTANKLFTLSKYHPVSVAIYNNSELAGIPWETIIKEYRKYLGEKSYSSLNEYANDLFHFMYDRCYFTSPDNQKLHLYKLMLSFMGEAIFSIRGNNLSITGPVLTAGITKLLDQIINDIKVYPKYPVYDTLEQNDFDHYLCAEIDKVQSRLSSDLNVVLERAKLVYAFYLLFTRNIPLPLLYQKYSQFSSLQTFSGIVFTGYGDSEIFPSLYSFRVQYVIDGKLSVVSENVYSINIDDDVFIIPFAQADVMVTLIDGIAPVVKEIYFKGLADPIKKLLKDISNQVRSADNKLADNIDQFINKGLQKYINSYISACDKQRNKRYTEPLVNSVAMLEKEDLADFAESLISITSVKRKMNLNEQNTVGGPIDVLVMSKGDGAVWMKRKHYFDPNLNPNFFNTYLKH